jgi:hypothetical protein
MTFIMLLGDGHAPKIGGHFLGSGENRLHRLKGAINATIAKYYFLILDDIDDPKAGLPAGKIKACIFTGKDPVTKLFKPPTLSLIIRTHKN